MAISMGAALLGSAVIGGATSMIAGGKASKAQQQAASMQIAEQRRQYDQDRADLAPWRTAGTSALARLTSEYGLNGQPASSSFTTSPGYDFRLSEGVKAVERSAASRGLLQSGAAVKAVNRFAEGNAAQEYDSYWNRLAGLAGVGQNATTTGIAAGQASTNSITNAMQNAGNARASSYANTGSAINSGVNNVLMAYLYSRGGGFGGGQ